MKELNITHLDTLVNSDSVYTQKETLDLLVETYKKINKYMAPEQDNVLKTINSLCEKLDLRSIFKTKWMTSQFSLNEKSVIEIITLAEWNELVNVVVDDTRKKVGDILDGNG